MQYLASRSGYSRWEARLEQSVRNVVAAKETAIATQVQVI